MGVKRNGGRVGLFVSLFFFVSLRKKMIGRDEQRLAWREYPSFVMSHKGWVSGSVPWHLFGCGKAKRIK
jgi:hypothetical protein